MPVKLPMSLTMLRYESMTPRAARPILVALAIAACVGAYWGRKLYVTDNTKDAKRGDMQMHQAVVTRVHAGESYYDALDELPRAYPLGAVFTLSRWREEFLAAGQSALKGKTGQADARDGQIGRLKKKVGELTMDNELLREKAQRLQAGLPLAHRRSRR